MGNNNTTNTTVNSFSGWMEWMGLAPATSATSVTPATSAAAKSTGRTLFKGVSMVELFECDIDELPEKVNVFDIGLKFFNFINKQDRNPDNLTKFDALMTAAMMRNCKEGDENEGLINVKQLFGEDWGFPLELALSLRDNYKFIKIFKNDKNYSKLTNDIIYDINKRKSQFLILSEDEYSYDTLGIPVLRVEAVPQMQDSVDEKKDDKNTPDGDFDTRKYLEKLRDGYAKLSNEEFAEFLNGFNFTPSERVSESNEYHQYQAQAQPLVKSEWPFDWYQFRSLEELKNCTEGPFAPSSDKTNTTAVRRLFAATKRFTSQFRSTINILQYSAPAGTAVTVSYHTQNLPPLPNQPNQREIGVGTISHNRPQGFMFTNDTQIRNAYRCGLSELGVTADNADALPLVGQYNDMNTTFVCHGVSDFDSGLEYNVTNLTNEALAFIVNANLADGLTLVRNCRVENHDPNGLDLLNYDPPGANDLHGSKVMMCGYPFALPSAPGDIYSNCFRTLIDFDLYIPPVGSEMAIRLAEAAKNVRSIDSVGVAQFGCFAGFSGSAIIDCHDPQGHIIGHMSTAIRFILDDGNSTFKATEVGAFILRNNDRFCGAFGGDNQVLTTLFRQNYNNRKVIEVGNQTKNFILPRVESQNLAPEVVVEGYTNGQMIGTFVAGVVVTAITVIGYLRRFS